MSILRSWKVKLLRVTGTVTPASEPEEPKNWSGFWHHVWLALPVILISIMLVSWAEEAGWFRGFETWHLDSMIRSRHRETSKNIVVVEISDKDYDDFFDETSPLDKSRLLDLILAVRKYNPSVIGVDIDTNGWGLACRKNKNDASCAKKCAEITSKLQQLRVAEQSPPGAVAKRSAIVWAAVPRTFEPPLQLNTGPGSLPLESDHEGIPRFPVDDDGSVRHFENRVEVARVGDVCPAGADVDGDKCYMPTFAQAILRNYPRSKKLVSGGARDERVIFNFYGDRYRFPIIDARQFLSGAPTSAKTDAEVAGVNKEIEDSRTALFAGRIVLIGGGFVEARDQYYTPVGPMQGVELNALAIQTDLSGGGIRDFNEYGEFLLDIGVSIFIVGVFYFYGKRPRVALGVTGLVIPVALVSSFILFNTFAFWFNFIPVAIGVIIDQLTHLAEGQSEAEKELKILRDARKQVEVDLTSVEEVTVAESLLAEAGAGDQALATSEAPAVDDAKVKRAASGAG
jgi:CHASE2 domain-containing sensor protein